MGGGAGMDLRGMIKLLKEFNPELPVFTSVEEIMDQELTLMVKMKSVPINNHEIVMSLFVENGYPFSLSASYDLQQI
jgi:hypothetical protein